MRDRSALIHYQPHLDEDLHACIMVFTYPFGLALCTLRMPGPKLFNKLGGSVLASRMHRNRALCMLILFPEDKGEHNAVTRDFYMYFAALKRVSKSC